MDKMGTMVQDCPLQVISKPINQSINKIYIVGRRRSIPSANGIPDRSESKAPSVFRKSTIAHTRYQTSIIDLATKTGSVCCARQ